MVKKIMNDEFQEVTEQQAAVVDFSATWCGPCKMLAPVLDKIAEELGGKAAFYNVDVDENSETAQEFGITNIPCIVVLKNGKEADRTVGFQPQSMLKAFIEKNL